MMLLIIHTGFFARIRQDQLNDAPRVFFNLSQIFSTVKLFYSYLWVVYSAWKKDHLLLNHQTSLSLVWP